MQYTINQLYDILYQNVYNIYDIFKGFFGEDNIDLHLDREASDFKQIIKWHLEVDGCNVVSNVEETIYDVADETIHKLKEKYSLRQSTIYVWWNHVTVTNENNKSTDIYDLYAKIVVQLNGRIPYEYDGFLLNRATYTKAQFKSNYMHSHIKTIPKYNFSTFMPPCLGKGPIRYTILTLKNEYDESMWMLFCEELARYVTVESLAGTPWKYLETIGNRSYSKQLSNYNFNCSSNQKFLEVFDKCILKDFIMYYLQEGHLALCYNNGMFTYGMPYYDFIIDISNSFIDYYNKYLKKDKNQLDKCFKEGLLIKVVVMDNKFYNSNIESIQSNDIDPYQGKFVLRFKGKPICIKIIDSSKMEETVTIILNISVAMYILENILKIINFRYRNEYYNKQDSTNKDAPVSRRVFYI